MNLTIIEKTEDVMLIFKAKWFRLGGCPRIAIVARASLVESGF